MNVELFLHTWLRREIDRSRDRQADRQTETDRQTDRQTDREQFSTLLVTKIGFHFKKGKLSSKV